MLTVALVAVSTSSILARMIPEISPVTISFWRMAVAGLVLWTYSFFRAQGPMNAKKRNTTRVAGVFLSLHFICFFGALKYTTVANATLLTATAPFFAALIERFILKRPWNKGIVGGLLLAFVGILIIQNGGLTGVSKDQIGNILAALSALWIAIVLVLTERVRKDTGVVVYARMLYTTAALVLLALAVTMDTPLFPGRIEAYFWLVLLGLVPTIIGHTLFYYTVKFIRPTVVSTVPLGEPVLASLLAFVLLGESVSGFVIGGGAITLLGIYIIISRH